MASEAHDVRTPDPTPSWSELIRSAVTTVEGMRAGLNRTITNVHQSDFAEAMRRGADRLVNEIGPQIGRALAHMMETYQWMVPPNWRHLTVGDMLRVAELMREEGLGLAWAPSAPVLQHMLAAPDTDARKAVLMDREAQVLIDLDRALDQVQRDTLEDLRGAARQAIEAHRSGYFWASQALAAAGLTTAIHDHLGRKFWEARRDFAFEDPEEEEVTKWRISAVLGAIRTALEPYNVMAGDPVPRHFNRHASAHKVGAPQFTPQNSLTGIMLLVSTIAELDWISATIERQEQLQLATPAPRASAPP